ncbi:transglutaminase TgpA family protein [Halobiforma nitratireducens]|uniref:Transglutaminase n=1 Tax=Halobiforma nitratireducens JCM 10879 TaxID=1227454 RepID=M0LI99_9EURY|nr:transglutaminaseTgpA domain-containing protein [Halobiforma nitratireducens]EMA33347.1 transglutaminase [Halobiforma nitratireducens JCM 10879]
MSAGSRWPTLGRGDRDRTLSLEADGTIGPDAFRVLALGCVLLLTTAYVSVLQNVTQVVGGTRTLLALVVATLLAATILARLIRPGTALVLTALVAVTGFIYYFERSGVGAAVVFSAGESIVADAVTLATGLELLRVVEAGVWTLAFAPGPVFLSWYLAVRGRYGLSVVPGGFALLFLVLTGDAGSAVTLLGVLAALGAVAFGDLERRGGSVAQADAIAVLFAIIVALSLSVTFVPGGAGTANPTTAGASDGTLEATIDSASERSGIAGEVDLSPEIRFVVEADEEAYWRTGVYDRYTGDEWVRTGQSQPYAERALEKPAGATETMRQTVTVRTELGVMPAAAHPLEVEGGIGDYTEVSAHGQIRPATTLIEGDTYAVESAVVEPAPIALHDAGTDYPEEIEEHYLQMPESISGEFEARTAEVTERTETPFETAVAIERYLRTSKDYSLEVDQPEGDAAEEFLLEMDEGYCVYFATTMTQMLRAEGIPARYVTGYTSGEQISDDEYVVRGTDAHAWVGVYFPDHGWVEFEPTPPQPREAEHSERLLDAQEERIEDEAIQTGIEDTPDADDEDETDGDDDPDAPAHNPDGTDAPGEAGEDDPSAENETAPEADEPGSSDTGDDPNGSAPTTADDGLTTPVPITRELVVVASVLFAGLLAGVHRTGATVQARQLIGLYWQRPSDDPDRDAERAFHRLEGALARDHRPRGAAESARSYVTALERQNADLDPRVERVLERYERAVYGSGVDRAEADETIEIVDEITRNRLPIVRRDGN